METRSGGCLCGKVRYSVSGAPFNAGLCHCADCRKESGSSFTNFANWPLSAFSYSGEIRTYEGRSFCPDCGARLFNLNDTTVEIRLGSLDDAPNGIYPEKEIWIRRREPWLGALKVPQHREDDPQAGASG
jgi:hypothetical protein